MFLASPGDLVSERKITQEVVAQLNPTVARELGWHIDLLGWEDTIPGFGRPQSLINPDVDACDLFIGVLWKRWGQATGAYTSGFEEEFVLALNRCRQSRSPQIWLCFKAIPPDQLADPGEQLARVIHFRDSQRNAREVLYKEFDTADQWRNHLQSWLTVHLMRLAKAPGDSAAADRTPEHTNPASAIGSSETPPGTSDPVQVAQVLDCLRMTGELVRAEAQDSVSEYSDFEAVRFFLLSSALHMDWIGGAMMEVHALNKLYSHRQQLVPTSAERMLLFRTLLVDTTDTSPGWFWFRDLSNVIEVVFEQLAMNTTEQVKIAALNLLKSLPYDSTVHLRSRAQLLRIAIGSPSRELRRAGIDFLARHGTIGDLPALEPAPGNEHGDSTEPVAEAADRIRARSAPREQFELIIGTEDRPRATVLAELYRCADQLGDDLVRKGLDHRASNVRLFALRVLMARNSLRREDGMRLLTDPSDEVRSAAFAYVSSEATADGADPVPKAIQGEDDRAKIAACIEMLKMPSLELEQRIKFYALEGPAAYEVLHRREFSNRASTLRGDVRDNFSRIREQSISELYEQLGARADEVVERFGGDIGEFVVSNFLAAALNVLAEKGDLSDADLARAFLANGNNNVRLAAFRVISRFGNHDDAVRLAEIAKTEYGNVKRTAAIAAITLAPGIDGIIPTLLNSDDADLVGLAMQNLGADADDRAMAFIEKLFRSTNDLVRAKAVASYVRLQKPEALDRSLAGYIAKGYYYYNVVCWLDRVLYAPSPLRDYFLAELGGKMDEHGWTLLLT